MNLLEKLRAQPGWQDGDAAVRAATLRTMAAADVTQTALVEIARLDDAPGVRCEALRRLESIEDVLSIGRSDPDETVRATATEILRRRAIEAQEDAGDLEIVLASFSARDLALVSRSARSDGVSLAAVSRLTDDKWLGTVARVAGRVEVAKAAVERMHNPVDLQEVALKSDDKTVALLAFGKLTDDLNLETLTVIAKRARLKAVARHAHALLTERETMSTAVESSAAVLERAVAVVPHVAETRPPEFAVERAVTSEPEPRREPPSATAPAPEPDQQENRQRLEQLCESVEAVLGEASLERHTAERALRTVRNALADLQNQRPNVSVPSRRARAAVVRRLRRMHTALLGRVLELREFEDWRRWANLGVQETLCVQLEALAATPDDATVAARYREIMTQWRQVVDTPKGRGEELRKRFQTAHDLVYPRCRAYLAAQAEERERNLSRRRALVDEAERLATSTDWLSTVRRITELQAQWKDVGPVPRRHQRETWARFRAACNAFFTRRKADLATRKEQWSRNLQRKQDLCARMEALAEEPEIAAALARARETKVEWGQVGPVRRKESDAVWNRFQAACDAIVARAQEREQKAAADKVAVREKIFDELDALLPADSDPADPPESLAQKVREIQQQWRQAPELPPALRRTLAARFGQGVARVVEAYPDVFRGTELDPSRQLKRLEALCERVESLADEVQGEAGASPAEILATKWRDALASNLMGARVDEAARRRAALEEVKRQQAERRRIGRLRGTDGEMLAARFQRACDRVLEADRAVRPGPAR